MTALGQMAFSQQSGPCPQERARGYFSTGEPNILCTSTTFHLPGEKGIEQRGERPGHGSPTTLPLPLTSQLCRPSQPVGRGCQALFSPAKLEPAPHPAQSFWLLIMCVQRSCF